MSQNQKYSEKINSGNEQYLAMGSEPEPQNTTEPSFDIKDELFNNRYFLKHRVWRNMKKIRRQYDRSPGRTKRYQATMRRTHPHFT